MKKLLFVFLFISSLASYAQDSWPEPFTVSPDSVSYPVMDTKYWQYADTGKDSISFNKIRSAQYSGKFKKLKEGEQEKYDDDTYAWVRFRLKNPHNYSVPVTLPVHIESTTFFIGHNNSWKQFKTGEGVPWSKRDGIKNTQQVVYLMPPMATVTVYASLSGVSYPDAMYPHVNNYFTEVKNNFHDHVNFTQEDVVTGCFVGFILFATIFNLLFFYVSRERMYLVYSVTLLFSALYSLGDILSKTIFRESVHFSGVYDSITVLSLMVMMVQTVRLFFMTKLYYPKWDKFSFYSPIVLIAIGLSSLLFKGAVRNALLGTASICGVIFMVVFFVGTLIIIVKFIKRKHRDARLFVLAALPFFLSLIASIFANWDWTVYYGGTWTILVLSWGLFARYKGLQIENARVALEKEEEKSRLIAQQNELLEEQVAERTAELQQSITELKQTQNQLIQSEKMASLGELTAGIAHEIQNPLNFVNNFSDVSIELLDEMEEELVNGDADEAKAIAIDIKQNLEKIAHHGRRADSIVKGMLQHSRASNGQKEPTDINVLADEYLRLAYHGLRAKDKSFNADLVTHFAEGLPKAVIMSQDVGRVLLNLFTNAFYATQQKAKTNTVEGYKPVVEVVTTLVDNTIEVVVKDNGTGIPDDIKDKILQPFFTTKPTGQGTGLGLSLSYDIVVKAHGGTIDIQSTEGEGAAFKITLPLNA